MKQPHRLQPKLRFPEFEGDWNFKFISEILSIGSGKDYKHLNEGNIPVYGTGGLMTFVDNYIYEGESVGIGRKGTIDKPVFLSGKFWTVDTLFYTYKFSNSLPKFVYNLFQRINWRLYNEASGVPSLSKSTIEKIKINIPSLPEQQKVADYLSTIDSKINLLEEKRNQLTRYKKAMMQELFSQKIRFKNENGNEFPQWDSFQLKDILLEHKEKNKGNKYTEVVSVAKEKGVINQIEHLGRSYSAENIEHYKVVNPYDVVYTKSPTSGFPFGIIKQNKLNRSAVLSPLYAVFKPKTIYLGMLLHDLFLSEAETFNYLVPLVQKGAKNTMNINNEDFLNGKKYQLPTSEKEQQKIADFLSAIDESIEKVNQQINQAQSFKKAMLQQMFV